MFDVNKIRSDFPILSREVNGKPLVYLDNGASAQKPQVVIDAVEPDSPANEAGVRAGDILTRLGSRPISRVSDVTAAADDLTPGSSVPARLIRGGSPLFIGIRVPDGD